MTEFTPTTRPGRPRRLHLDQVIDAAVAVGPGRLTMGSVARHLGVAKAVLYGYVGSRDELVQLAAARAVGKHRFPLDEGQPWSVWILEYARALFEVMTMDGELFESWMSGNQSPKVEVDAAELWLSVLVSRGFAGEEAVQLRRAVSHLVLGAAASMRHERALVRAGIPRRTIMQSALEAREPGDTMLLRQFMDVFARELTDDGWEFGLYLLLRGAKVAREALDPDARGHPFAGRDLAGPASS